MRAIRILLPLWSGRLQARLLFALRHQFGNGTASVVTFQINGLCSVIFHFLAEFGSRAFIDAEVRGAHDDAVVFGGTGNGHETAVDFLGDNGGGACQGVSETAAAPRYPFEDVAWRVLVTGG
jgi:hypothetical protein